MLITKKEFEQEIERLRNELNDIRERLETLESPPEKKEKRTLITSLGPVEYQDV